MIDAAIIGLGWWGRTLVESVQGHSDDIRFAFPISLDDMAHGASVTEAVVRSAASGAVERVA